MQVAWLPSHVCSNIDQVIKKFVWNRTDSRRGIHLISWDIVTKPKTTGGLRLRQSRMMNTALLGKLLWTTHEQPNKNWVSLICAKYGKGQTFLEWEKKTNCSKVWLDIIRVRDELRNGYKYRIGLGFLVSIWHDNWLGQGPLINWQDLVEEDDWDLMISDILDDTGAWNFLHLRTEISNAICCEFPRICQPITFVGEDKLIWGPSSSGQ
ncbi:hypothetical protein K2173_006594 [Erythroxylum novogranatense]|uniref:Uncharacterized protein n=1 Tax=Erythroxylum novogranatense TaxID=1862640 RepID=A0AAV8T5D3_9ROSI|nr:hypothetical protein K2173_006594 [Erythroxylum novogranatense]